MVTIYDISKLANVSPMTVSRVINQSGKVSEKTREKVEQAIRELDYIPNASARYLNIKHSKILSLVITDITNPFFTKVARGAEDKAKQMGYRLILCNSDENTEKESDYISMLISSGVDGVLMTPAGDSSSLLLKKLTKHRIPYVLLDRKVKGIHADEIKGDSKEGTKRIMRHLIELGHERIAIINGPLDISTARERQEAYVESLKEHQLPTEPGFIFQSHYRDKGKNDFVDAFLEMDAENRPTAVFAANNTIAVNTIKELREHAIEVPRDVSVACFDDLDPAFDMDPFLTVVSQPAYQFGFTGMQMLIERIEDTAPPEVRSIILPSRLIIRKSTAKFRET